MEISSRKSSKRMQEPVDEWLQNEGYFRKHAPRDPTCLFRAFSEQIYNTQFYHIKVRKECVEYMRKMKYLFEENITIPYDNYLEQMACFTEWGGMNEIHAMSLLYEREVVILNAQKQNCRAVTNNGFKDIIYLCHIPPKQYESVFTREYIGTAAFCQSLVYRTLYKKVFHMSNVDDTVHKMLHSNSYFRHDKFFQKGNLGMREQLTKEMFNRVTETGNDDREDTQGYPKIVTPFPYRVAKALDPYIYRNTDFDIWHEIKREVKNAGWTRHNSNELQVGGKCLIQIDFDDYDFDKVNNNNIHLDSNENDVNANEEKAEQKCKKEPGFYYGHIQEMSKNNGPVVVFIEDLGEKRMVPYDALKPLPLRKTKQSTWQPMCRRNVLVETNQKWRKGISPNTRRTKEPINMLSPLSNPIDRSINNNNIHNNNGNENDAFDWKDESSKENRHSTFSNYSREKCANYGTNASGNVFSGLLETKPHVIKSIQEDIIEGRKQSTMYIKSNNDEDPEEKNNNRSGSVTTETSIQVYTHSKQRLQKEIYYPPQSGNSNGQLCYVGQDGNPYSLFPYIPINFGESMSSNQMDRIMRCLNSSTQKNADANGTDLPLSDPFALRFFYNLGLEYFRASYALNFALNGQAAACGWYYNTQVNNNMNAPQIQKDAEHKQEAVECNSGPKEISNQGFGQKTNGFINNSLNSESQLSEFQQGETLGEKPKDYDTFNKDIQRTNKSALAPRFKKNADARYRNNSQQANSPQQQQTPYSRSYQYRSPTHNQTHNSPNPQDGSNDNIQGQPSNQIIPQAQLFTPNYTPYVQPTVYGTMPCYMNDMEPFGNPCFVPNAGFHPVPLISHPDILEGNNQQPCSPHMCPTADNYPQAIPPPYPYLLPQQVPYSNVQLNVPESWYPAPFPPPPQYYPYALIPPNGESCNGMEQNMQNAQSIQNNQNSL